MDRRTRKTKNLLWNALINLILEKGYEKVIIQDIIEKADVGRSTFYSHYESKEQLLFCGQSHLLLPIFTKENDKKNKAMRINFTEILKHAEENTQLTKSLLEGNLKTQLYEHIDSFLKDKVKNSIHFCQDNIDKMKFDLSIKATSAALTSLILNWIKKDTTIPFLEIEEMINKVIVSVLDIEMNNL